jgi:hypothetical protein
MQTLDIFEVIALLCAIIISTRKSFRETTPRILRFGATFHLQFSYSDKSHFVAIGSCIFALIDYIWRFLQVALPIPANVMRRMERPTRGDAWSGYSPQIFSFSQK